MHTMSLEGVSVEVSPDLVLALHFCKVLTEKVFSRILELQ